MKLWINKYLVNACLIVTTLVISSFPVMASAVGVPAPMVGAVGPLGVALLAVAYVGYRVIKYFRNR